MKLFRTVIPLRILLKPITARRKLWKYKRSYCAIHSKSHKGYRWKDKWETHIRKSEVRLFPEWFKEYDFKDELADDINFIILNTNEGFRKDKTAQCR